MRQAILKTAHSAFVVLAVVLAQMLASGVESQANAQTVSQIVVEGNHRVERETVLSYMQISVGDPVSASGIDASIKALFQTGLFSDVQIYRRGNGLLVVVAENPLINKVSFEGNSELDDEDLAKEVQLTERHVLTRAKVQSDVQRILALYRAAGHFGARVTPKTIQLSQNRVNLVFEIDEGVSTTIDSITFVGNEAFSDSQLRSVISTSESAWWKFFSTTDRYDPDRLSFDKELLRRYYLQNGFADFRVLSASAELARDGESFFITFTLDEGQQYNVGKIVIDAGGTNLTAGELAGSLAMHSGELYDASQVDKSIENMTIRAGRAGYAFAKVQPKISRDEADQTLDILFQLEEGPRVYIERIEIYGNTRTLDEVIRRELRLVEGDAYNRILVDRGRRRLVALDYFEKVEFKEVPGSAPDKVILAIYVIEKSTGTINFSAGYSTTEGVVGSVNVTERNFLGKGQYARLSTNLSFDRQSIDASFTEPYFLGRRMSAGVDAFATRTDQESESSFTLEQFGGAVRLGFPVAPDHRTNFKYQFTHRIIDVKNPDNVSEATAQAAGTDNISLIGITHTYDTINNPRRPSKGTRLSLATDFAGLGGDISYVKSEAKAFYFMPLFYDGIVLKLKGTAGHIEGLFGDEVLIIDRFFKGSDSFRGFERAGVGPRQVNGATGQTDSIGGQTYAIGTVEVIFPLGLPESFGLEGVAFTDFGTIFNVPEHSEAAGTGDCSGPFNCTVFDEAAFRGSIGGGIMWESPFGPLRLDAAWAYAKTDYDRTEIVRFSAGTRF